MSGARLHPRDLREPIVQAPMAGGPSTPALAAAVSEAGGLGFLAAGYRTPQQLAADIAELRDASTGPFGVNLFVPTPEPADPATVAAFLRELEGEAARQDASLGEPRFEDDHWLQKLELLAGERVAVVSFTFGCPSADVVERLQHVGSAVWVTITDVAEARAAVGVGADALVVQGSEAGGHRASFTDDDDSGGTGLLALLRLVSRAVELPLIASGGIPDGPALAAVLCAGASAAQIGSALMLADEAATHAAHRELLTRPLPTRLTRAFSGRLARGLANRFLLEHSATAPAAYPEVHHATSPLRAAARARDDADAFNLWAGQAHELAEKRPAGEIVREMAAEARATLARLSRPPA